MLGNYMTAVAVELKGKTDKCFGQFFTFTIDVNETTTFIKDAK